MFYFCIRKYITCCAEFVSLLKTHVPQKINRNMRSSVAMKSKTATLCKALCGKYCDSLEKTLSVSSFCSFNEKHLF